MSRPHAGHKEMCLQVGSCVAIVHRKAREHKSSISHSGVDKVVDVPPKFRAQDLNRLLFPKMTDRSSNGRVSHKNTTRSPLSMISDVVKGVFFFPFSLSPLE